MTIKKINLLYWISTILFAAFMTWSAYPDAFATPDAIKFTHDFLGYPVYFIIFIGVAKLLGVAAILIPGFPRVKEWAYAGLFFDLIGAVYSLLSMSKPDPGMLIMLIPFVLGIASYIFHHKKLKAAAAR